MKLAVTVMHLCKRLPREDDYALGSQIRRAAASVPANIAEGNRRGHRREYVRFVSIARASAAELETYLELIGRAALLPTTDVSPVAESAVVVGRMLNRLFQSLCRPRRAPTTYQLPPS